MTEELGDDPIPTSLWARVQVGVAGLLVVGSGVMSIAMPRLISEGGIQSAQDFLTLSPVFFPRLTFGLLALLSIPFVIKSVRIAAAPTISHTSEETVRLTRAGLMTVIAILYALVMTWLGFILATMLAATAVGVFLGLRQPLLLIPGAIALPVLLRFVFERLFFIALPRSSIDVVAAAEDATMKFLAAILQIS